MEHNARVTIRGAGVAYTARGVWERTAEGWLLTYEEPPASGLDATGTALALLDGAAVLTRSGAVRCTFRFAVGAPHTSVYETRYGSFPAEVVTHTLRVSCGARGALVEARYTLTLGGASDEHRLKIIVRTEDEA